MNRKDFDNSIGIAPAVYLDPVNETKINNTQKFSIPAFELFSNSVESNNKSNLEKNLIDLRNNEDHTSIGNQGMNDNVESYYVVESYQDPVGDGLDLFRGQEVIVKIF